MEKHPMFPNEDTSVTCGRHPWGTCTEAHDSHVAGLIERDKEIEELRGALFSMNEELAELRCAKNALIEVLNMSSNQSAPRTRILRTEGGEEIDCLLIPREEVESVLERYEE